MKARELMIGDWVMYSKDIPSQIDSIERWLNEVSLDFCDDGDFISVDNIEPIPLTEDILKANGWNKNGAYNDYILRGDIYDFIGYNADNNHVSINIDDRNVKQKVYVSANFVHELQRALRCCDMWEMAEKFKIN